MLKFKLHDYPVVDSTNDEAKALLEQGAGEGTIVRATRQTAGRGRRGRRWVSEPGNLYFSVVLVPECSINHATQLSFVMAVAVGEALLPYLQPSPILSYKWPNDVLLDQEKVGGILIETESVGGQTAEKCVVGIGLNIVTSPPNLAYPVTYLNAHAKKNIFLDMLFDELLRQINTFYQVWKKKGFVPIREQWLQRAYCLGEDMTITMGENKRRGKFLGLSSEGALLLQGEDGVLHTLMSAEIL